MQSEGGDGDGQSPHVVIERDGLLHKHSCSVVSQTVLLQMKDPDTEVMPLFFEGEEGDVANSHEKEVKVANVAQGLGHYCIPLNLWFNVSKTGPLHA